MILQLREAGEHKGCIPPPTVLQGTIQAAKLTNCSWFHCRFITVEIVTVISKNLKFNWKYNLLVNFSFLWIVDDITTFLPSWWFFLFKSKIKLYPPHLSHNFLTTFLPPWSFLLFKSKTICFLMVFLDRDLISATVMFSV